MFSFFYLERQNVVSYKQQVEKLNKRIRDLIQAQTTAFHELEEERKKAPADTSKKQTKKTKRKLIMSF